MKDLITLSHMLYKLSKDEETDINIHIPVSGKAQEECLNINNLLWSLVATPIVFGAEKLIYPHVTVKMGTLRAGAIENVLKKIDEFSKSLSIFEITPNPVILKMPAGKYFFSEIEDDRLLSISELLDEILMEDIKPSKFTLSKENLHHITLGYKFADSEVPSSVLGEKISPFLADRIQVSVMGKYGVCVGTLKTFYLK